MFAYDDDGVKGGQVSLEWPAAVSNDPDYPELAPIKVDLASDAIVYKPVLGDDF